MCIRSYLIQFIQCIDVNIMDQVWVKFTFLPDLWIGGCYIPPSDSPYFTENSFSAIQERLMDQTHGAIVLGDFNARLGQAVNCLLEGVNNDWKYNNIHDNIARPNTNGVKLLQLCSDLNCLIINNLETDKRTFPGSLTFRRKHTWISELDLCLTSAIDAVIDFKVNKSLCMPSDHAPISVTLNMANLNISIADMIKERAALLGSYDIENQPKHQQNVQKGVHYTNIDPNEFQTALQNFDLPSLHNIEDAATMVADVLYKCSVAAKHKDAVAHHPRISPEQNRWKRIMDTNDDKMLWNAINWRGEYMADNTSAEWPSDAEFQQHLEDLLNPPDADLLQDDSVTSDVYVPILDNPICPSEVDDVIQKQMKPNKGCGPDGISPGIFRLLPVQWIMFITSMLNCVFMNFYPSTWNTSRLKMLFKKGDTKKCDNYRGISIINSISKLYDYILCNRLNMWFVPDREQAGAQAKRGCIEHIVSLRLLMDYCRRKKLLLYVVYVDFSKAYDRVPRKGLMNSLKDLGCGKIMLAALVSMYKVSKSILGMAIITSVLGVKQGSPTSCFLFTLYVNKLIRMLKDSCGQDGYLGWLHALLLMDDTVILATSREQCKKKVSILLDFCQTHGMKINEDKTKFMVLNGTEQDQDILNVTSNDGYLQCNIGPCDKYTYLGSIFTCDGKILSSVEEHATSKRKHLLKLVSFLRKNRDMPFSVKRKVFNACFMSSIVYSCESWINVSTKSVEKLYVGAIKALLDVRITTCNELCLIELGLPRFSAYIKQRQREFFVKASLTRQTIANDPLMQVWSLIRGSNSPTARYIDDLTAGNKNFVMDSLNDLKDSVREKSITRSKMTSYMSINPQLQSPALYSLDIAEYKRIAITRLRVISHNLKIETGRWSRIARENRLCPCDLAVQTEKHVVESCQISEAIRLSHPEIDFDISNISSCKNCDDAEALYKILKCYTQ